MLLGLPLYIAPAVSQTTKFLNPAPIRRRQTLIPAAPAPFITILRSVVTLGQRPKSSNPLANERASLYTSS